MTDSLGEFEQLVLLAALQLGADAHAAALRERIQEDAQRRVSRGALYSTLDRLESKGFVTWEVEESTPARGGIPRRLFEVTDDGVAALRRSYGALRTLASGLESILGEV